MLADYMSECLENRNPVREAFSRSEHLEESLGSDNVFDLGIGSPTAPTPANLRETIEEFIAQKGEESFEYMDCRGYPEVREGIARSLAQRFSVPYTKDDIIMTSGAACALTTIMYSLLDPHDEVITFLPRYASYSSFAQSRHAELIDVPLEQLEPVPDFSVFQAAVNERTKAVLVNSPNNPSGLVWSERHAERLANVMEQMQEKVGHEIYLISDELYRELVYDGASNPCWPKLYDNTLVVYSFAASASLAGERIGHIALSPNLADAQHIRLALAQSLEDLGFVNASAIAQYLALACADETVDISYYDKNRLALYDGLVEAGFSPLKPKGSFYMLLPAPDGNEEEFIKRLEAEHIIVVGGASFGCPGTVRLSFSGTYETIVGSLPGFRAVAQSYGLEPMPERTSA